MSLHALSALRFPVCLATAGRQARGPPPFIVVAYDAERRPLLLLPLALGTEMAFASRSFMGGKHTTFNMALWRAGFRRHRHAGRSRRAGRGDPRAFPQTDVLALHQQPLRWRDLPNPMALLPHQPSANDCPLMTMAPGAAPSSADQQLVPAPAEGQGTQAADACRLSLSCRATTDAEIKRPARLVLRVKPLRMAEQKLPNVFAEPGIEEFIRARLPDAARRRRPRHRYPCARMRRGSDRDLRRRRRRPPLLDDVQHLHDVGERQIQPRPDPDARHHRSLCRARLPLARSRHRIGRLQAAVLQGRRADLRQLHAAQPARQDGGQRDVRCQPRQAPGEAATRRCCEIERAECCAAIVHR